MYGNVDGLTEFVGRNESLTFIHATSIVHCLPSTVFSFPRMLLSLTCRPALCGQVMILFEIYEFMRDFLNHHRNGLAIPTRQARELFGHHCNPGPIPTTFTKPWPVSNPA